MGYLSTHILDTSIGMPATGVTLRLYAMETSTQNRGSMCTGWRELASQESNADGRCDSPLLEGAAFATGSYQLVFGMGAYFRKHYANLPDPLFLDDVVVRFAIADATRHYHIPLLVSPWGYTTYRGS